MDEVSLNNESVYDEETEEFEIDGDCTMADYIGQAGNIQGENPLPPAVGVEFESYDDVYYFYNCYAKDQGFGVRVSNTWYRKSRERYRGKLSCSSAGFKKKSEANRPRPETRTGCPAMIKFRLMENKRWRIIEVELEHNHLLSPRSGKFYKSHRTLGLGSKRPLQIDGNEESQKLRLFRTVIVDSEENGNYYVSKGDLRSSIDQSNNQVILEQGDAQALHNFFANMQLLSSNFFYVIDLNDKGCLRNVFWADAKCRASYRYFGDILAIDTSCLKNKHSVPLVVFAGVNHHHQAIPLGCGLVSDDSVESFIWLFRAWLTYMAGRPPQTIIINLFKSLQLALAEVFPRASYCISVSHIMKKIQDELGGLSDHETIQLTFARVVHNSVRADEFETSWEDMLQKYGIRDHLWLQMLYDERKHWVPVYLKETFLAGLFSVIEDDVVASLFDGYLDKHTTLKAFLNSYDQALQEIDKRETLNDMESRNPNCLLKSRFHFEVQMSKLYTVNAFRKFQGEVERIFSCLSPRQLGADGSLITYLVREHTSADQNEGETRDYEVLFNTSDVELQCVCGLFNLKGYLCRHALSVLHLNGFKEIPNQYILPRWRKDIHRNNVYDHVHHGIDINHPVHRYDHLHKCALKVVEEGRKSHDLYKSTLLELDEILNTINLQMDQLLST